MKLKHLFITQIGYGPDEGKYKAEIEFENERGSTKLQLTPELSNTLLLAVGKSVVQHSALAAKQLEQSCIESVTAAENIKAIEG